MIDATAPRTEAQRGLRSYRKRTIVAVAGAAIAGLVAVGASASQVSWPPLQQLMWTRGSGWLACGALWLALAISPLDWLVLRTVGTRPWTKHVIPPVLRRALGITAAWLACAHALAAWSGPLQKNAGAAFDTPHLLAGASALAVLLVLLATSFGIAMRYWKPLHRLAFVAALLVLQHLALSASASRALVLGLLAALCALLAARAIRLAIARLRDR